MKKLVSMILCFIMVISLCSCGKEKKAAQEVYDNVGEAYELLERFSSDIYSAWRTGIYEDDVDIKTLSEELYLSEEELQER